MNSTRRKTKPGSVITQGAHWCVSVSEVGGHIMYI